MLIVALVLAVFSLAALVTAVVTSNELIAWACIGFSALGVLLLIVDAIRDRNRRPAAGGSSARPLSPAEAVLAAETTEVMEPVNDIGEPYAHEDAEGADDEDDDADDADEDDAEEYEEEYDEVGNEVVEDHPDELVYDDPEHDLPSDDEPAYPIAAEEAAIHVVSAPLSYPDESSSVVPDEPSYMVTESPTVSYTDNSADDSVIVIYSGETESGQSEDSEERGGER